MVLEYLPNGSLDDRLRDGAPLADAETLRVATELAAGLAHAHGRGLVHRDLKPANVLFDTEERAKIADFGIARMSGGGTLTEAGTVLGTASYISPEQAGGLPAGPPSDVYSFGVILYRMLTGMLPFVSSNAMELVRMHRDDPPPAVTAVRPDAPADLASVVTASLAKDPAARPADGEALLRALQGADETATIVTAPAAAPAAAAATQVLRPASARQRDWPIVPIAAVAALLLVAGGALAIVLTNNGSSGNSPPAGFDAPERPGRPIDDRGHHDGSDHDRAGDDHRGGDDRSDDHDGGCHHDGSDHDRSAAHDDERTDHHGASRNNRADHDGAARHDHRRHDDRHHARDDRGGHDHDGRSVRALYFGTYDRAHPRNVNAIAALRLAGAEIEERQAPIRRGGLAGALNVFAAEWRLLAPRAGDFDVVIVGYPGHFDVPRARRLARKRPLVFDAVLSLENELVAVRRHFRDRSTAATVLRAVGLPRVSPA